MKRILSLAAALLLLCTTSAFAEKNYVTKDIAVNNFTSVQCGISCEVEYVPGAPSFTIFAVDKTAEHITNFVKNGVLIIDFDKDQIYSLSKMKITISSPYITGVDFSGTGKFKIEKGLVCDSLIVNVKVAAKFEAEGFKAGKAVINVNGTCKAEIEDARCGSLTLLINGGGGGDVEGIECDKLVYKVNGAGGGDIEGHAKEADLTINGAGGIGIKNFKADKLVTAVNGIGGITK